jgi:hypothetical protein
VLDFLERYCLLIPYPIEQEYEIIGFDHSDIALAVAGSVVVGRGVKYHLEGEGSVVDRAHFRAAYPEVVNPLADLFPRGGSRDRITLSIDDWARVVSLGRRPVSKYYPPP